MAERRKRLTEKLKELDEQLEGDLPLDATALGPLQEAIGKVRKVADAGSKEAEPESEDLGDLLGDLAMSLEVSHPKVTALLNRLSEILGGAGI